MKLIFVGLVLLLSIFALSQDHTMMASDQGHAKFQPAYAEGRLVQYQPGAPAPETAAESDIRFIYELEYPTGWQDMVARPLCNYCDHAGDGENAWDYHDHVFASLPTKEKNDAGEVYWHVLHVLPAYTGDAAKDAELVAAYASQLPVQSGEAAQALLETSLPDGTPLATVIDTSYVFTAPLTRW